MATTFVLDFTKIKCDRCGSTERIAGRPCPECDDPGRANEVNGMLARRRQGVRAIRDAAGDFADVDSEPLPYYLSRSSWHRMMVDALEAALDALSRFAAEPLNVEAQSAVALAIARLREIERDLTSFPSRRPYISDLAASTNAATCFVRMADAYLDAFEAPTPIDAQLHGKRAQQEIDKATEFQNQAELERELGDKLGSGDPQNIVDAALDVFAKLHPDKNIMQIDAHTQALLERRIGRRVASGQGASYAIAEVLAKSIFDVARFRSVVTESSKLFISEMRLRAIAEEPGSMDALRRAREAILESTVAFNSTLSTATTDEARLRRTLNLYRELFEDAGLPLFAWFLRVAGVKGASIAKLLREDSTELLAAINRHSELASLFVGADKNIRTAASHGFGYELVGQDVVFNIRSFNGTMTVEVLIDLLLALTESLLAAFWVLDNELAAIEVEGHTASDSLLGASMFTAASHVLKEIGATVIGSERSESRWQFEIAAGAPSDPYVYAWALASAAPKGLDEISIECSDLSDGELRIPRVAIDRFVEARDSPPMTSLSATLNFLAESTLDGRSALSPDHLRRFASLAGEALIARDETEAVHILRACIRYARTMSQTDVLRACEAVLVQWRSPASDRLKKVRATISLWSKLPIPMPLAVRSTTIFRLGEPRL